MMTSLIGGIALAVLALVFEVMGQSMKRMALRSPALVERAEAVRLAKEKSAELTARCKKLQDSQADINTAIDRLKIQMKKAETQLARVPKHHRIVEEIGVQTAKAKRFDGTVWNVVANSKNVEVSEKAPPGYFANEVQIIIWAEDLGEARQLLEKTFPSKDGYQAAFLGDIFGKH